jgi:exosome complex RNA-binding protein Rrp42 (RNase PH superfamily)
LRLFRYSLIDKEDLSILKEEVVRVLFIDAVCMCDKGNLFDAVLLASLIALKTAQLSVPKFDEESGIVYIEKVEETKKLKLKKFPISLRFAIFNGDKILLGPSTEEIIACNSCENGSIGSIVIDLFERREENKIISFDFNSRNGLTFEQIKEIKRLADDRINQLRKQINFDQLK